MILPRFKHQERSLQYNLANPRVYDMSDAGTGKTRVYIDLTQERPRHVRGKTLVLAPKSILYPAWGNDIEQWAPNLNYTIAYANNRAKAFKEEVDIYITNHDAVKWIANNLDLTDFNTLIVDEMTAFKNPNSQRSKALAKIKDSFDYRYALSGTPNPNGVLDLWHQVFILDDGEHLGPSFYRFRSVVCEPSPIHGCPGINQWTDKPGAEEQVALLLLDMTIRNKFDDCVDIPPNTLVEVPFELSPKHRELYEELKEEALLQLEHGEIIGIHAGALQQKLLQIASGAVYDGDKTAHRIATERYELTMELARQRGQCLTAFMWKHQRDELTAIAKKMGRRFGVIDGEAKDSTREQIVKDFQAGKLDDIFAHPQSASHGLTLTAGSATIWPTPIPTRNAEHYEQFNRRVPRTGQKKQTETIHIQATNTLESTVYSQLLGKVDRMDVLRGILQQDKAA